MRWTKAVVLFACLALPAFGQFGSNATKLRGKSLCSPLSPTNAQVLTWDSTLACWKAAAAGSGTGDMLAATYDPAAKASQVEVTASKDAASGYAGLTAGGLLKVAEAPTWNQNTTGTSANVSGTPALPNGVTATTQSAADNSTKLSTTAYVDTGLALKANLASPTFTGTPAAPTPSQADNSTKVATTAYVDTGLALKAPLASPALTGNPTAPTQSQANNSTRLASTAYVDAALARIVNYCSATPSAGAVTFTDSASSLCVGFDIGQLSAAVTSATFSGFVVGKQYWFHVQQNGATTRYNVVWPSGFLGFPTNLNLNSQFGENIWVSAVYGNSIIQATAIWNDAGYNYCLAGTVPPNNPTGGAQTYCSPTSFVPGALLPNGTTVQMGLPNVYALDNGPNGTDYTATSGEFDTTNGYVTGMRVRLKVIHDSVGGATTLALNGLTAKSVYRKEGSTPQNTLSQREWLNGSWHPLVYDGTSFYEESPNFPRKLSLQTGMTDAISTCTGSGAPTYFTTTYTLAANELGNGGRVHLRAGATHTTSAGIAAFYYFVKAGSTVVGQNASASSTALTNIGDGIDLTITGPATAGGSVTIYVDEAFPGVANLAGLKFAAIATNGTLILSVGFATLTTAAQTCTLNLDVLFVERLN